MANNEGNPSEQSSGGRSRDREDRDRGERDGRDGRYRFFIHPDDPGFLQSAGYTPQMTAAQHEYRLRNMEIDQLRNELQTCKRRIQDLERQTEGQQRERSSRTGRFMQHWDGYDEPRYVGHYPGEDERGYPYSRHQHIPAFVMNPDYRDSRYREQRYIDPRFVDPRFADPRYPRWDEPFVHRIDVDLLT